MSGELDQRLAMLFVREKLAKEYDTDPVVNQCLKAVYHGHASIEEALVKCIQLLVEQKSKLMKDLMDHEWERPHVITLKDGTALKFDPRQVREQKS